MTRSVPVGEVRPLGDRAVLVGVADAAAGRALAHRLRAELGGADRTEVVPGAATVMVSLVGHGGTDPEPDVDPEEVHAAVARTTPEGGARHRTAASAGRLVTVPCAFDGPDLDEVAARAGCSPARVVDQLTAQPLEVAVVGFSPGFAYLDGLVGPLRRVPRRDRPRPVVPAGSVALANGHAAVYPTASPGGWQLVGRTGFPLFSAHEPPYAVLAPGDLVHLAVAAAGDPLAPPPTAPLGWSPARGSRAVLDVVAPGLRAVLQDGGRRGVAAAGVPGAGPADPVSFALANRLVSAPPGSTVVELTGGGTRLRALAHCHVAVVGASPEVRVDGRAARSCQVLPLEEGQVLEVGRLRAGCRTYLAVAGGFGGPALFGSRASDELTGLGPGPLGPGRTLHAGPWAPPLGDHLAPGTATEVAHEGEPVALRVVPGPHPEQFAADALGRLADTVFTVETDSNRVGIRLREDGTGAGLHRRGAGAGALDSHGVVTGAVQVPPGGGPVVLLPDHATLGGYPVLAVVASVDHGRLGQCAPGTRVRFAPVSRAEATEAARAARRSWAGAVVGHFPLRVG